ncbi:MAG: hypothetical protein OWQ59_02655 [Alicyclobacillaceae bacterium]|nr:hypothetical protein [Alicyclobacillaceae bacterium]
MQKRLWGVSAAALALTCLTVTGCGTSINEVHKSGIDKTNSSASKHASQQNKTRTHTEGETLSKNYTHQTIHSTNLKKLNTDSALPREFENYHEVLNSVVRYIATHTSLPVYVPTTLKTQHKISEWIDVQYFVRKNEYRLTLSHGAKLPANAPNIIVGNGNMIYSLTALSAKKKLTKNIYFDQTSGAIAGTSPKPVVLGKGIIGKIYRGEFDDDPYLNTSVVWKENGWTFSWVGDQSIKQAIKQAAYLSNEFSNKKLPISTGKCLFAEGSGGPSQAEFVIGETRYILYAPEGLALNFVETITKID